MAIITAKRIENILSADFLYVDISKKAKNIVNDVASSIPLLNKDVDLFFTNNFIHHQKIYGDNVWNSTVKSRFFDIVGSSPFKEDLINSINQTTQKYESVIDSRIDIARTLDNKSIKDCLVKIEEISYFLETYQYNEDSFKKRVLCESMALLSLGDVNRLNELTKCFKSNVDKLTIESILDSTNYKNHSPEAFKGVIVEQGKNTLSKQPFIDKAVGTALFSGVYIGKDNLDLDVALNMLGDSAVKKYNSYSHTISKIKDFTIDHLGNNLSPVFDSVSNTLHNLPVLNNLDYSSVGATTVLLTLVFAAGCVTGKVCEKIVATKNDSRVGGNDIYNWDKDNYDYHIKYQLNQSLTKIKKLNNNEETQKQILLTGFLEDKLSNPLTKIEDYQSKSGVLLKDFLKLSDNEINRLNNITKKEICAIAGIDNIELREILIKNTFTSEELLAVKRIDSVQKNIGNAIETKGDIKSALKDEVIWGPYIKLADSLSPISKAICSSYIKNSSGVSIKSKTINMSSQVYVGELIKSQSQSEVVNNVSLVFSQIPVNDSIKLNKISHNNAQTKELMVKLFEDYDIKSINALNNIRLDEDTLSYRVKSVTKNTINSVLEVFRQKSSDNNNKLKPN